MIKAVILDLDGTIVSPVTGTYSAAVADAFKSLRQNGIKLIAATGRSPYELQYTGMIDGLPLEAVACLNGQYCYTEKDELFVNPFPVSQSDRLLDRIGHSGFPCAVIQKAGTFINYVTPLVKKVQDDIHMPVPEPCDLSEFYGKEIMMFSVFLPVQNEAEFIQDINDVSLTRWNAYAIDLVPAGFGKCRGLEIVLSHFGIDWSEVFAFGDGDNDYEMLKRAGKGFAMRNSSNRLLNGEFEVTDTVDDDGVVKALRKYGVL